MKLILRQSGIKDIIYSGSLRNTCWLNWKTKFIDGIRQKPSEAMMKGAYFEFIVGVNRFSETISLPKNLKNGKKTVAEERLEMQAMIFEKLKIERKMMVSPENTQVKLQAPYGNPMCPACMSEKVTVLPILGQDPLWEGRCFSCEYKGDGLDFSSVTLEGTIDILSPFLNKFEGNEILLPLANIDTKVTQSLDSSFGDYQWENVYEKDYVQAIFYHKIFFMITGRHLYHVYLVFDYKPKYSHKIVYKIVNNFDLNSIEEDIRRSISEIYKAKNDNWKANPSDDNCRYCPLGKSYNEKLGVEYGDGSCKMYKQVKEQEVW